MTWKRVLTAAMLIPAVVAPVLLGSTALVTLILAGVALLALFEYFALGEQVGHRGHRFWTSTCVLALMFVQWLAVAGETHSLAGGEVLHQSAARLQGLEVYVAEVFLLFALGVAILTLTTRRPMVETLPAVGMSASGLLLIAFPLSYAIRVHGIPVLGPKLLLFVLVLVWVGDTAAYFVGRSLGRWKMAPRLSPKKTWEGAAANLLGSLGVALLFARWLPIEPRQLLPMAGLANVAGQMGDLLESAYKRSVGVKDSSALLPGHGGILDRIDALILAVPVVWYYFSWWVARGAS